MVSLRLGCDKGSSYPARPAPRPTGGDGFHHNRAGCCRNLACLGDFLNAADTQRHLRYLGGNRGASDSSPGLATSVFIHF